MRSNFPRNHRLPYSAALLQVIVNVNVIVAAIGCHRQPIYKFFSLENSPLGMKTPFRGAKLAMRITTAYHDATTILRCDRNSKGHIGFHPAVMRQALP